jgi:uroporphyrinogen-III decarboxylase
LNARERVLTALRGGEPDRVPCALGFFPQSLFGAADADEYFGTDVRFVDFAPPAGQDAFLDYLESLPRGVHVGSTAQLRTYHEWDYHPERPESEDAAAVAGPHGIAERIARLLPRVTDRQRHAHLGEAVERLHARGLAVAGSPPHLGGELFESAWRMRGFDLFMKDLVKRPELVDYLLDQLETMATESARILAAAGVDVLVLDDDVAYKGGLLISPAMWRRHFKPRLARIIAVARQVAAAAAGEASPAPRQGAPKQGAPGPAGWAPAVLYHCDGDFSELIGDLVEIGVDAVNPVAPDCMDAMAIRRSFGARPALWGTIGTTWTWDTGSPAQIREEVRTWIESLGGLESLGRGGLLLCPAYDLDFSPRANVAAFVGAVREFG